MNDVAKIALKVAKSTTLKVTDIIFTERIAFTEGPHPSLDSIKTLNKEQEGVVCVSNYADEKPVSLLGLSLPEPRKMHFTLVDIDR